MHGFGARHVSGRMTVSQCQRACLSDSTCVAVDFDHYNIEMNHCWLLGNDLSPVIGPAPGVTHFILDRKCDGKPQHVTSCLFC